MTTSDAPDLTQFLQDDQPDAPSGKLVIVGVIRNTTASSVELAVDNLANWLTLPTVLIEEATCLGVVKAPEPATETHLPLFSIALKRPRTQSERFFFNLVMPPFFMAAKNRSKAMRLH